VTVNRLRSAWRFLVPSARYDRPLWWVLNAIWFALGSVIYGLIWGWSHVPGFAAGCAIWQVIAFVVTYERRRKSL
jgi:hypothetical protein